MQFNSISDPRTPSAPLPNSEDKWEKIRELMEKFREIREEERHIIDLYLFKPG